MLQMKLAIMQIPIEKLLNFSHDGGPFTFLGFAAHHNIESNP